jgi:hypothetical protein
VGAAGPRIPGEDTGSRVYDTGVTEPAPQETPPAEAPQSRARASTIGAVAFVLLAAPFLVFGWMMFNLKGRVELECAVGGPCVLVHQSWLSRERMELFTVEELQGATVERNRSNRRGGVSLYRPVLETTRGKFPLSSRWLDEEDKAERTVRVVNAFRANPFGGGGKGFLLFHDQRRGSAIVGISFTSVGVLLLGVSVWLGFKARRHRRAERAK